MLLGKWEWKGWRAGKSPPSDLAFSREKLTPCRERSRVSGKTHPKMSVLLSLSYKHCAY